MDPENAGVGDSEASTSTMQNEEPPMKITCRNKRHAKKKISLVYLLKVICASQESCLDWLKNKGLLPKILFCPNCSKKMKFEADEEELDGYMWICTDCKDDPPKYSTRHGSWLESRNSSLVDIMIFTYLWAHSFSEDQIAQETNMMPKQVKEWDSMYADICCKLYKRNFPDSADDADDNLMKNSGKDSPVAVWRRKTKYKDPFIEFLNDADSL